MGFMNISLRAATAACLLSLAACAPVATVAPLPPPTGSSTLVGVLPGKADFSDGTGLYSIDLKLPPGRNEITPPLTLRYNSRAANGVFGMGWYLFADNEVGRCPAT